MSHFLRNVVVSDPVKGKGGGGESVHERWMAPSPLTRGILCKCRGVGGESSEDSRDSGNVFEQSRVNGLMRSGGVGDLDLGELKERKVPLKVNPFGIIIGRGRSLSS